MSPVIIPLSRPGIPLISVKLFWSKYSSHVALRKGELQNSSHSSVVQVTLLITSVFMHLSKSIFLSVRLPSTQILMIIIATVR